MPAQISVNDIAGDDLLWKDDDCGGRRMISVVGGEVSALGWRERGGSHREDTTIPTHWREGGSEDTRGRIPTQWRWRIPTQWRRREITQWREPCADTCNHHSPNTTEDTSQRRGKLSFILLSEHL